MKKEDFIHGGLCHTSDTQIVSFSLPCHLSKSAQAVVTNVIDWVAYNRNVFFIVLETGKSQMKKLADLVPGENPLPGL